MLRRLPFLAITAYLAFASPFLLTAEAGDIIRDERRLYSDGNPQEIWFYQDSLSPDNLIRKEIFWEEGKMRSRVAFQKGTRHGVSKTWYRSGALETEETWVDGELHGVQRKWPDPWNSSSDISQLKPSFEASYKNGKRHGALREWSGRRDNRWLKIEQNYVDGELDGEDSEWENKDSLAKKHSWKMGKLNGKQLAWGYSGEMLYQYNFVDGVPEGPQRKYEGDRIVHELFFVEGQLHGKQTWPNWQRDELGENWEEGLRTDSFESDDGVLEVQKRYRFVPEDYLDNSGKIRFSGKVELVDRTYFYPDGTPKRLIVEGRPGEKIEYWPNGQMKTRGPRVYGASHKVMHWYEDGTVHREEFYVDGKKSGEWLIRDRQGRIVQRQVWDYYLESQTVTLWHDGAAKAAEGNLRVASGSHSGPKDGEWTYWYPDGTLLRTEKYGPGPYSGNRPFIKEMTEYLPDGRIRFQGSEKELVRVEYDEAEPTRVVRRQTIKLLDRSRHGVDSWDGNALAMKRHKVDNPTEIDAGAIIFPILGTRGLVLKDEHFYADGRPSSLTRYDKKGVQQGLQEGWYPDGVKAYSIDMKYGRLLTAEEWWPSGTPRLRLAIYSDKVGAIDVFDEKGGQWRSVDEPMGTRWRRVEAERVLTKRASRPDAVLEACVVWKKWPQTPQPVE